MRTQVVLGSPILIKISAKSAQNPINLIMGSKPMDRKFDRTERSAQRQGCPLEPIELAANVRFWRVLPNVQGNREP